MYINNNILSKIKFTQFSSKNIFIVSNNKNKIVLAIQSFKA